MDAAAEQELFRRRLPRLATAGRELIEHHHLRGTTEEVKLGQVGNYTQLLL